MWFKPINVSECFHFCAYFLGQFGWEFQKRGAVSMWMFQHWASLALPGMALDWVVVRHHICSKGEIVWKAIFGNQAMENKVSFLSVKFDCWESIWCLMKQEKYFLPQEIRMLTGYYFEYFNILADTSVPKRYKLLFHTAADNLAADGRRLMQRVSE